MSQTIVYVGTSDVREIKAASWTAVGVPGEPDRRWEQSNSYEQVVSDAAAIYLLAQGGEFVSEAGLQFPAVVDGLLNTDRLLKYREKEMKYRGSGWPGFNREMSRRSVALPVDVLIEHDSIGEGWVSLNGPSPQTQTFPRGERDQAGWVGRFRRLLQLTFNPEGRGGQWVPAGSTWWGPSPWLFSANGADTEINSGISLRGRKQTVANANPATITVPQCDTITFFYNKANVFGGCDLRFQVDAATVQTIWTYDGALASLDSEPYTYVWSGTRGAHTVAVQAMDHGSGFNTEAQFIGAFFGDGDTVRVWNGSHFGYTLAVYNAAGQSNYFKTFSKGLVKPKLIIVPMGTNDSPSTYKADLLAYIASMHTATDTNGQVRPAWVVLTPPAAGANPNTTRDPMRLAAYEVMATVGGEVWEWNELQGSVAVSDGNDALGITYDIFGVKDNTHPGGAGMRNLGEYVFSKFINNTSIGPGLENLNLTMQSGRRRTKVIGNSGSAQTIDAGEYQFFSTTLSANCTFTLSAPLAGDINSRIVLAIRQDPATARTVTFSPTVKWAAGTAFTATATINALDLVELQTFDGGSNWYGKFTKGHA